MLRSTQVHQRAAEPEQPHGSWLFPGFQSQHDTAATIRRKFTNAHVLESLSLKGLIRPFKGLIRLLCKGPYKALKGPYKALEGLLRPSRAVRHL